MKITQNIVPFLSVTEVSNVIKTKYGFEPIHCILMGHLRSSIFLVTNEFSNYIFKIYGSDFHQLNYIKGEVELLNTLYQEGAAVSYPIKDIDGEEIQRFETKEGVCHGILFSYAEGEESPLMNKEQLITLGRELARIHTITSNITLLHQLKVYDLNTLLIDPLQEIKPAFHNLKEDYDFLSEVSRIAITRIESYKMLNLDNGYIHYDLSPSNVHFDEQNSITFFDFDIAGKGNLIQDVIAVYMHFFNLNRLGKISKEKANDGFNIFVDSYQQTRKLHPQWMEIMPYFGFAYLVFGLNLILQHFEEYSYQDYLKDRLQLIRLWVDAHLTTTPNRIPVLSESEIREQIQEIYELHEVTCILHPKGNKDTSTIYVITDPTTKYIYKVYDGKHHRLDEIKGEVELLTILHDKGASVSFPIKDPIGNQIQDFNTSKGSHYGVLYSYAEGESYEMMTDEQLVRFGKELAVLHTISSGIKLSNPLREYDLHSMLIKPLEIIKPVFKDMEDVYHKIQETSVKVIAKLEQLHLSNFDRGYLHFDLDPSNMHFQQDNSLTFFDFDIAGKGYLIQDIAGIYLRYFGFIRSRTLPVEVANHKFDVFLDGYEKVRKIEPEQLEAIPYFCFIYLVFTIGFIYERYEDWPHPDYLAQRLVAINSWTEVYITE